MGIFGFWIVLSILVGIFAGSKGLSGFGYFVLSLLLSPLIALIILLINQPKTEDRALITGASKKCPYCAELIRAEARVCRYCQRELLPTSNRTLTITRGAPLQRDEYPHDSAPVTMGAPVS